MHRLTEFSRRTFKNSTARSLMSGCWWNNVMARGCNPPYCGGKYDKNYSMDQSLIWFDPHRKTDFYNLIISSNLLGEGSQYQPYLFIWDIPPIAQTQDLMHDVKALYRTSLCIKVEILDTNLARGFAVRLETPHVPSPNTHSLRFSATLRFDPH